MNAEEQFWQGLSQFNQSLSEPVRPEFRAYYNSDQIVTHYTAFEFAAQPNNYILITESEYADRDGPVKIVAGNQLKIYERKPAFQEFRLRPPASGFTPDAKHANILYHDSDRHS